MTNFLSRQCTAFAGLQKIASGPLVDVALAVKAAEAACAGRAVLTFDDTTGAVVDLDLRGSTAEIVTRLGDRARLEALPPKPKVRLGTTVPTRGRPKLGVVAREVTLLPRHWEWLASQSGGASQALRRLVDQARRSDGGHTQAKAARETTYRFLTGIAGDLPGFEEAARALFSGDEDVFAAKLEAWPPDVRNHALKLAIGAGAGEKGTTHA